MVCHQAEAIVSNGVALQDAPRFFETSTGVNLMKPGDEHSGSSFVFRLRRQETVWIPYGAIAQPLFFPTDQADTSEFGVYLSLPIFQNVWCTALSEQLRRAVVTWSHSNASSQTASDWNVAKAALLKKFGAATGVPVDNQ